MRKQKILNKINRLKNKNQIIIKEEVIVEEKIEEVEEEKEEENNFFNLVDELEETKKKDIKKFVKENRDEINALETNLKNQLLDLIKDKLY
jgi:hypothetical protein